MRAREGDTVGIVNGISDDWNPETDEMIAKKYTIIVKSDNNDIVKYVRDDWTGFYDDYPVMENVYREVNIVIKELMKSLMEKETEQ